MNSRTFLTTIANEFAANLLAISASGSDEEVTAFLDRMTESDLPAAADVLLDQIEARKNPFQRRAAA